jgi:hypothetical protein
MANPAVWRSIPPIVIRITTTAVQFPGINAYVMEVLAQRVALSVLRVLPFNLIYSDCQSAINSVRAILLSQLKRALGTAPAGVILASMPAAPDVHLEWTRAHPERRIPDRSKWSYTDWGIFLADAAASNDWSQFHSIYGQHRMTPRILSLDLRDIIFELLSPSQCYWVWRDSGLPVLGDLNVLRLHLHSLPRYLVHRDADRTCTTSRAPSDGVPILPNQVLANKFGKCDWHAHAVMLCY